MRCSISKFIAFQIGICTFKWDETHKKYLYRPFCFYVWPRSKMRDRTMMFQVSYSTLGSYAADSKHSLESATSIICCEAD